MDFPLLNLGPAHKLALFNGKPHEFLSGGEDGLMIHIDVRQPKPNKLVIQKGISKHDYKYI